MPTTSSILAVRAEAATAALSCPAYGDTPPAGWNLLLSFTVGDPEGPPEDGDA